MAGAHSRKASEPEKKRVGRKRAVATTGTGKRKSAGPTSRKRILVLDGTFSIEEIEVKSTSRRKAAKTKKKTSKKVGKKESCTAKRAAKPKTAKKRAPAKPGPVVLESSPCIRTIVVLRETLAQVHGEASPVVIDASKVESIDTAALQLLVAFAKSRREQSRDVDLLDPSTVFCETATLLNLSEPLGIGGDVVTEEDDGLLPVF